MILVTDTSVAVNRDEVFNMTTQIAAPHAEVAQTRKRRRFSVGEYYAMAEAGILTENDRVELLDGEIVVMAPIGNRHQSSVDGHGEMFTLRLQGRANVRIQGPVRLDDDNEPEPDVTLLRRRDDYYATGHPGPDDVLLLIEVADTTLDFDRKVKLPLYARAGIPEVWIVNLQDRRVEVYTEPDGVGYGSVRHYGPGESVAPLHFPDIALEVERIIPA